MLFIMLEILFPSAVSKKTFYEHAVLLEVINA